jgi:hypothetical protein
MSTEDIRATDIEAMSLEAVQTELRSNDPGTEAGAQTQEHLERRQRLWQRLDTLIMPGGASQPTGRMAGMNEGN